MKDNIIKIIELKVSESKTNEAIEDLEEHFYCQEVLMIKGNYTTYQSSNIKGIISNEQSAIWLANINNSILTFLERQKKPFAVFHNHKRKIIISLIPIVLVILVYFFVNQPTNHKANISSTPTEKVEMPIKSETSDSRLDTQIALTKKGNAMVRSKINQEKTYFEHLITGVVNDIITSKPLKNAKILITEDALNIPCETLSDSNGSFQIKVKFPINYTSVKLWIERQNYQDTSFNYSIDDGRQYISLKPLK